MERSFYFLCGNYIAEMFWILTLMKEIFSCTSFPVGFLVSFMHSIISSVNKDTLTSSFPICIPLISFSYLIALAKTSSAILNRYRKSGQPCLVPDFSGIVLSFSLFTLVLAMVLM